MIMFFGFFCDAQKMQELKDSTWWKLWKIPGIIHTVTATPKAHNSTCLNTKCYISGYALHPEICFTCDVIIKRQTDRRTDMPSRTRDNKL